MHVYRLICRIDFSGEDVPQFKSSVSWAVIAVVHGWKWLKVCVQDPVVSWVAIEVDNQVSRSVLWVGLLRPAADLSVEVFEGAWADVVDADSAVLEGAILGARAGGESLGGEGGR